MRCVYCQRVFRDGAQIIPVHSYVSNDGRGDFVSQTTGYVHIEHLQ